MRRKRPSINGVACRPRNAAWIFGSIGKQPHSPPYKSRRAPRSIFRANARRQSAFAGFLRADQVWPDAWQAAESQTATQSGKGMTMSPIDPQDDPVSGAVGRQDPAAEQKKVVTFTILHTNDMHSNLIGVGPASE
jgi:hypothetical protein